MSLHGLTWDHPRGYAPLRATSADFAARRGVDIRWDARSLTDFGDVPVRDIASGYDLLVIDHPHIGDAVADGSLLALDDLVEPQALTALDGAAVGRSDATYRWEGRRWAVAVDAACQVAVHRRDLLAVVPSTWEDVQDLARSGAVLWPLKPVDAICSLFSLCAGLGTPCGTGDEFFDPDTTEAAVALLATFAELLPPRCLRMSPVDVLEELATASRFAYCPLLFGYTDYARLGGRAHGLTFTDIPGAAGPVGAVLGGAGLAVSGNASDPAVAAAYAVEVAGEAVQRTTYFDAGGQPAHRAAWDDPDVDATAGGFFSGTRRTMDASWIRPRHRRFVDFQTAAGAALAAFLTDDGGPAAVVRELNALHRRGGT